MSIDNTEAERCEISREEWEVAIVAEREHQRGLGYTAEHDRSHGAGYLLRLSDEYARKGKRIEAAALMWAAYEVLATERADATVEWAYWDGDRYEHPIGNGRWAKAGGKGTLNVYGGSDVR